MRRDGSTNSAGDSARPEPGELPEVRAFLDDIGYGHYFREEPAAEREDTELPPCAPPATSAGPSRDAAWAGPWRGKGGATAAVAVLALLYTIAWPVAYDALRQTEPSEEAPVAPHYTCATLPLLGTGAIEDVQPGLTPGEVRGLLGLPLYRVPKVEAPAGEVWIYPPRLDSAHVSGTEHGIHFAGGRVLRVAQVPDMRNLFATKNWMNCPARYVGNVDLALDDGRVQSLRVDEERPAVLKGSSCPVGLGPLPVSEDRLFQIREAAANGPDAADDWVGISRMFPLSIYYRGFLVHIPPSLGETAPYDATRGDVEWLLRQLHRQ